MSIINILERNVYVDSYNLFEMWPYLDCLIENVPDAEYHNSYLLTFKNELIDQINDFINQYTQY